MKISKLLLVGTLSWCALAQAWEENPWENDFKVQDALFKQCQLVTNANKYEAKYLEKRDKDKEEKAKREKAERIKKRKQKEKEKAQPKPRRKDAKKN